MANAYNNCCERLLFYGKGHELAHRIEWRVYELPPPLRRPVYWLTRQLHHTARWLTARHKAKCTRTVHSLHHYS